MYTYTIILLCVYIHTYIYIYTHNITCHLLSFGRSSACSQRVSPRGRGHLQLDPVHVLAALLEDISLYIYYTYMDIYIYIHVYIYIYIYVHTYIIKRLTGAWRGSRPGRACSARPRRRSTRPPVCVFISFFCFVSWQT